MCLSSIALRRTYLVGSGIVPIQMKTDFTGSGIVPIETERKNTFDLSLTFFHEEYRESKGPTEEGHPTKSPELPLKQVVRAETHA